MNDDRKTSFVLLFLTFALLGLAAAFRMDLWGRPAAPAVWPPVDASFTNTATVRQSAAELIASKGDTSGLECYACHERGKPPTVHFDENGQIKLPEEHNDLVMQHGQHNRNIHCFNCHDPENLDTLKTRDGRSLKWAETTELCASCHGPTYRDWKIGIHGRVSGYWDLRRGPATRVECASCHHPHAPQFPQLPPAPPPRPVYRPHATAHSAHADSATNAVEANSPTNAPPAAGEQKEP